jgi:hypothetical protein
MGDDFQAATDWQMVKGGELSMQFHIRTETDKVIVCAEVTKIEIEDIGSPDVDDFFCRIIRITGFDGEAIEVFCESPDAKRLGFHRVKKLKPVRNIPRYDIWLTPRVYTGSLDGENT